MTVRKMVVSADAAWANVKAIKGILESGYKLAVQLGYKGNFTEYMKVAAADLSYGPGKVDDPRLGDDQTIPDVGAQTANGTTVAEMIETMALALYGSNRLAASLSYHQSMQDFVKTILNYSINPDDVERLSADINVEITEAVKKMREKKRA